MYAKEIMTEGLKPLASDDTGENATVRMYEYNVNQLPVIDGDSYIGIITMEEIMTLKHLNDTLKTVDIVLKRPFVHENAHLFEVMKAAIENNVKIVPVLSKDDKYLGLITAESCLRGFATLESVMKEGGIVTLSMPVKDFQLSEIARIVEGNGANILAYYSDIDKLTGIMQVTLKLNTNDMSPIIAAFERYEYNVKGVYSDDEYNEDVKDRYDALMKYLDV